RVGRDADLEMAHIRVKCALENALLGALTGEDDPSGRQPSQQVLQRGGVEHAVPHLQQGPATVIWHDRADQIGAGAVQRRAYDIAELGGEVTVIVVDIDQVDVVAVAGLGDELGQRIEDRLHVRGDRKSTRLNSSHV